ncbi:MAG: hypothetical protein WCC30_13770 [Candidatus Dormiibacterota bacterium]
MSPLFGRQVKPFIDETRGDAEAARLRAAAASGDWQAVDAALGATVEPKRREFLVDAVPMHTSDLRWVDAWVRERPESAAARTMWGACAVQHAWNVRSGAEPRYVPAERMKAFQDWLTHADEQLSHAAALAPDDSAPWVALLWCAIGLGTAFDETWQRWQNVAQRDPDTELGALAYATYIGPRWHGAADMMWKFVLDQVGNEPAGSPLWSLVPHGHFEQWVAERMDRNSQVHASRYFQQPEVQNSITDAYGKYLGSPARERSYLEPQFRELFAGCFYLMGERDLLRKELEQIGPGIQNLPWNYLGSPLVAFQSVREAAGLK